MSNYRIHIYIYNIQCKVCICHFRMIENAIQKFNLLPRFGSMNLFLLRWSEFRIFSSCFFIPLRQFDMMSCKAIRIHYLKLLSGYNRHGICLKWKEKLAISSSKYNAFHLTLHRRIYRAKQHNTQLRGEWRKSRQKTTTI